MLKHLTARFQKKKINEALSNPKGAEKEESPLTTRIQKATIKTQMKNRQDQLGEDIDSFDTSNPQIARLNSRITQLKMKLSKKEDPNIKRQAIALIAQKERLESQAAKNQMRRSKNMTNQTPSGKNVNLQQDNPK